MYQNRAVKLDVRTWHFSDMSGLAGESAFYLRTLGAPKASWTVGARGKGSAGPVFLHVGTASVEPTEGHTYDPTDGATTDPYPAVPACASAAVPERANAVASTIVLRFMAVSFSCRSRPRTPRREKSALRCRSSDYGADTLTLLEIIFRHGTFFMAPFSDHRELPIAAQECEPCSRTRL